MPGTWASGWITGDVVTAAEFKKGVGCVADTTLGASAASIDFTSLPTTYAHLLVVVYARSDRAATLDTVGGRFNGDSAANYDYQYAGGSGATTSAAESLGATSFYVGDMPGNTAGANLFSTSVFTVSHYAGSSNNKSTVGHNLVKIGTASGNLSARVIGGAWRSSAAINRITLVSVLGNFVAGTRASVYVFGA